MKSIKPKTRKISLLPFIIGGFLIVITAAAACYSYWTSKQMTIHVPPYESSSSSLSAPSSQQASIQAKGLEMTVPFHIAAGQKSGVFDVYKGDSLTISGTNLTDIDHIVVTYTPEFGSTKDQDVYRLKSFKPGDTVWKYAVSAKLNNLRPGLNEYVIQGMDAKNHVIAEKTLVFSWYSTTSQTSSMASESEILPVAWHEPKAVPMLDIYKKSADYERYVHYYSMAENYERSTYCTLGGAEGGIASEASFNQEDARQALSKIMVYEVGTIQEGNLAGAAVYAQKTSFGGCMISTDVVVHFLQEPNGTLHGLRELNSTITAKMPWDGKSFIDANAPKSIDIHNGKFALEKCTGYGCGNISLLDPKKDQKSLVFLSGQDVYDGQDGCYLVPRKDGFLEEYQVNIPDEMMIRWKDGTTTTAKYISKSGGGCSYDHGCHIVADVSENTLEKIGTTDKGGLDVYQEKLSQKDIVAMGSGTTTHDDGGSKIISLYDLYWSMPRYEGALVPTPREFVAKHPAIYIKDPLGRLLFFRTEQYGPQVECGKPVIYLYPIKEQDVSVYVRPTGGLTITEPDYGTGWHVRSTPDSNIFNYADGKSYPYLFWEGHGKNYTRPTRGFVVKKADVPGLLQSKLALFGLSAKESADFREFWEPKLTASPYVFITFLDQATFDQLAPLEVVPTPDTVIRVFMDYEPLDAPVVVEPLPITTPVRRGFTVIEWGGALHRTGPGKDWPICSVLLQ